MNLWPTYLWMVGSNLDETTSIHKSDTSKDIEVDAVLSRGGVAFVTNLETETTTAVRSKDTAKRQEERG